MVRKVQIEDGVKVLFSNPPWFETVDGISRYGIKCSSRWFHLATAPHGYKPYPMWLGFATSNACKHGFDAELRDSICTRESEEEYFNYLSNNKFEYIVAESQTSSLSYDMALYEKIAKYAKVIVCGACFADDDLAQETIDKPFIHAVLQYEYDNNVITALKSGESRIFGPEFMSQQQMNDNPPPLVEMPVQELARYIDTIPYPRPLNDGVSRWTDGLPHHPQGINFQIFSNRGCFRKCLYCCLPATFFSSDPRGENKRTVRFYDKEWILDHLTDVFTRYPQISAFYDDADIANQGNKHSLMLCEVAREMAKRFPERTHNGRISFSIMGYATSTSKEVFKEMFESGCYGTKLGIESGSQRVLDKIINKSLNLEKALDMARYLNQEVGMFTHFTFSSGAPGETVEEMQMTKRLVEELQSWNNTTVQWSGTSGSHGTPLWYISKGEHLPKYPDAIADDEFIAMPDGQLKIEKLRQQGLL